MAFFRRKQSGAKAQASRETKATVEQLLEQGKSDFSSGSAIEGQQKFSEVMGLLRGVEDLDVATELLEQVFDVFSDTSYVIPIDEQNAESDVVATRQKIESVANLAPVHTRETTVEGIMAVLRAAQAGQLHLITELIARTKVETSKPRSHAHPPGTPASVPPSRRHVADLTPKELEERRKKEAARVARWRAQKRRAP